MDNAYSRYYNHLKREFRNIGRDFTVDEYKRILEHGDSSRKRPKSQRLTSFLQYGIDQESRTCPNIIQDRAPEEYNPITHKNEGVNSRMEKFTRSPQFFRRNFSCSNKLIDRNSSCGSSKTDETSPRNWIRNRSWNLLNVGKTTNDAQSNHLGKFTRNEGRCNTDEQSVNVGDFSDDGFTEPNETRLRRGSLLPKLLTSSSLRWLNKASKNKTPDSPPDIPKLLSCRQFTESNGNKDNYKDNPKPTNLVKSPIAKLHSKNEKTNHYSDLPSRDIQQKTIHLTTVDSKNKSSKILDTSTNTESSEKLDVLTTLRKQRNTRLPQDRVLRQRMISSSSILNSRNGHKVRPLANLNEHKIEGSKSNVLKSWKSDVLLKKNDRLTSERNFSYSKSCLGGARGVLRPPSKQSVMKTTSKLLMDKEKKRRVSDEVRSHQGKRIIMDTEHQ